MNQPNSAPDAFTCVAAWYFDNPPASWRIARHPSGWWIVAADGTYISWHPTKRDAAANLTDGSEAHAHYDTLDWLLGYSPDPRSRPLADAERAAIARILSSRAPSN